MPPQTAAFCLYSYLFAAAIIPPCCTAMHYGVTNADTIYIFVHQLIVEFYNFPSFAAVVVTSRSCWCHLHCCFSSLPPLLCWLLIANMTTLNVACTVGNCDINTNLAFSNEDHWVCKNSIIFFSKKKIAFATIDFLACVPNLCIFDTHTLTHIAAMTMWGKDLFFSRPKSVLGNS